MPRTLTLAVASFFGAGYAPFASGTFGTLATLPVVWAMARLSWPAQLGLVLAVTAVAMVASHGAGRLLGVVDSRHIVIDEVAGFLVTMVAVPFTAANVIAGFALFRLFDIVKPWPASYFDRKVKNGAGVVMDDVMAGLYARACLALLAAWFPGVFAG